MGIIPNTSRHALLDAAASSLTIFQGSNVNVT